MLLDSLMERGRVLRDILLAGHKAVCSSHCCTRLALQARNPFSVSLLKRCPLPETLDGHLSLAAAEHTSPTCGRGYSNQVVGCLATRPQGGPNLAAGSDDACAVDCVFGGRLTGFCPGQLHY